MKWACPKNMVWSIKKKLTNVLNNEIRWKGVYIKEKQKQAANMLECLYQALSIKQVIIIIILS